MNKYTTFVCSNRKGNHRYNLISFIEYNMSNRTKRIEAIKYLISLREITQQVELVDELLKMGFVCTQATVSRDLKQLKVAKASTVTGKYVYVLPNDIMYRRKEPVAFDISTVTDANQVGFKSLTFSGNLAVIRTRPGYASHLAYDLDNLNWPGILGTVAGDDTIILVLSDNTTQSAVSTFLREVIPFK